MLARLLAQKMQQALGQNVIIDNRPGAGGALGARAVAAAEPDGYTLFYGNTSTLAVIPAVSKNPGYDPVKNFAPIASVSDSYMILVVHPSFPAKTVQEFVAYAKANPGKLNFGHAGAGNVTHLTGEMFRIAGQDRLPRRAAQRRRESISACSATRSTSCSRARSILLPLIHGRQAAGRSASPARRASRRLPMFRPWSKPGSRIRGDAADRRSWRRPARRADRRQAQRRDQREPEDRRHEGPGRAVRITSRASARRRSSRRSSRARPANGLTSPRTANVSVD